LCLPEILISDITSPTSFKETTISRLYVKIYTMKLPKTPTEMLHKTGHQQHNSTHSSITEESQNNCLLVHMVLTGQAPDYITDPVAAPRAWNRLPTELKCMRSSIAAFRRHLKSYIFRTVYYVTHLRADCRRRTTNSAVTVTVYNNPET